MLYSRLKAGWVFVPLTLCGAKPVPRSLWENVALGNKKCSENRKNAYTKKLEQLPYPVGLA
jgi:hypothetical protein